MARSGVPYGYKWPTLTCRRCGKTKADRAFPRDRRRPTGRAATCRKCHNARSAELRKPSGYVRDGPVPQTPYFPPGTLHPVWRCESCNVWQQRNGEVTAPVCMNCSDVDDQLPDEIAHAAGSNWIHPDDQVHMVEAMRLAPENRRPWNVCPKCGRPKSTPKAVVCRVCYRQGLAPEDSYGCYGLEQGDHGRWIARAR